MTSDYLAKMDDSAPQKEKRIDHQDSVFEIQYASQKNAASDSTSHGESKDQDTPPEYASNIYELVVKDFKACITFLKSLKLEVIMFIYMFSYIMRSVSSSTMILEKVCLVHMGYSEEFCQNLDKNLTIKKEVEKMATNYHLFHTLLQIAPSSFLGCFIGPWSDRYGRKLPIIVALVGIILDGFGAIACAAYKYSRIEYYVASGLFTGLSGGFVSVLTVVYSSASDTTTAKNRTLKYTLLELAFGVGIPLGQATGGWIYNMYSNYAIVFATSVVGHCLGLLWVFFVIEETRGMDSKDPFTLKMRRFFTLETMLEGFRTVSKRRPHRVRLQIWLLVLTMSIVVLTLASGSGITYIFTYHQYSWGNTKYSNVSASFSVISMLTLIVAVPLLLRVLKVRDAGLGIMGSASVIAKNITLSFATREGLYYLANLLGVFSGMANLAARSRISKIVSKGDLGKVFSFVSTVESLCPVLGTAAFSQLFNLSLSAEVNFPGMVFLILGLLMVISLFVYIWIAFLPAVDYNTLQEEQVPQGENSIEVAEI